MENDKTEYKKRQTAYKIKVKDIEEGKFGKENDSLNYVYTNFGPVSRANIFGFIISLETSEFFAGAVVDDGTGRISVRSFDKKDAFENFGVGDVVNVIGRVRLYGEQKYIAVEIIKKTDKIWLEHRKKESVLLEPIYKKNSKDYVAPASEKGEKESAEEEFVETGKKSEVENVIQIVRNLDSGNGADVGEVIKKADSKECERIIQELLKNGDVFEILPGKIKVLE